jgi:thiol:disulfide interchange protein DsbD
MMKKLFALTMLIGLVFSVGMAQTPTPVKWTWKAEQVAPNQYKITLTAQINKGWHVYSQYIKEGGPIPTKVTFDTKDNGVQLVGKTDESGPKMTDTHDPVFDMQLKYFENQMVCTQVVKITKDVQLKGTIEFMVCDDKSCLPPTDVDFSLDLKAGKK